MSYTVDDIQDSILDYFRGGVPEPVYEQAIPNAHTLLRHQNGTVREYYSIQFGDLQRMENDGHSFMGPRHDNYELPIHIQAVSSSATVARKLGNRVNDLMLGSRHPYSGLIRKRFGGSAFPVVGSNYATEAYVTPAGFGLSIQVDLDIPE